MSSLPNALSVPTAAVQPSEHTMTLPDGTELFYRAWLPSQPTDKALIFFHRGHEHSGRFQDVVDELRLNDVAIFAWDARGHGRSPGDRGYAPSFAHLVKDVDCFVRFISQTYAKPLANIVVMAHSVGAVTVATWVHDYAPPIRAMILVTPALRVKLYVPFAIPGLRLLQRLKRGRKTFVKSYVKAKMLTHDADQARRYAEDPLIARAIAVNILLDMHDTSRRLIADAAAIRVPTLLLAGGADWVVRVSTQRKFFDRLGSPSKRMRVFDGMYHDVLHEKDRHLVLDEARQFIKAAFDSTDLPQPLLDADQRGHTKDEYDRLTRPLPALSPRGLAFAVQRLALKTLGRLSRGVQIGWQAGFDSGTTLDYVYENKPQGVTPLGRWFDRGYLNSIGWRGIRQRRIHLQDTLRGAIEQTHTAGRPVRLLDIASGPGRYVLETMQQCRHIPMSAVLRDYKAENLVAARRLADELGLADVVVVHADAFDRASLAAVTPRPTIAIVSGLYELFPENEPVLRSLRGLADAVEPGGYLIYTNQPWHPQLDFIARVLTNREGKPWIMRCRTQAEMDDLVRAAGFEKVSQEIDPWGIFTVSLARRVGP